MYLALANCIFQYSLAVTSETLLGYPGISSPSRSSVILRFHKHATFIIFRA